MGIDAHNHGMAGRKRKAITEKEITGLKYFDKLVPLLERLRDVGCQRDKADNRRLHFDEYCLPLLLAMFNPIARSMRALQQASGLRKVQRKLGVQRFSLGSLSEATEVFDTSSNNGAEQDWTGGFSYAPGGSLLAHGAVGRLDAPRTASVVCSDVRYVYYD
ncbi:MAG: hypothetical protein NTW96_26930 [Planctomycetia bacterium]|nr:hypothetical protein [Planctomycetia bacterium]